MKDLTLVIMAAGMGSRYGGLKQIEPVGPNGEFIIDYSIYDAKRAGFNKVVFIIKEENYEIFRDTVGKRVEGQIEVKYAFQKMTDIPEGFIVPEERTRPWGPSHAVLITKDMVKGNFAIINADDFYGKESYEVISEFFKTKKPNEHLLVGYKVANTLSENGEAKRGICKIENDYLVDVVESLVENKNGEILAKPLNGQSYFRVKEDTSVSMNMFGFTDEIYKHLEKDFLEFFERNKNDLTKCERIIPDTVGDIVKKVKEVKVKVIPTTARWLGITYKEDKELLVNEIRKLIEKGEYPDKL